MLRDTPRKRIKNRAKFPGIVAAARALGVTRIHLYLVLSGKRESKSLRKRYRELKRNGALA